jgi:hypothetical protein
MAPQPRRDRGTAAATVRSRKQRLTPPTPIQRRRLDCSCRWRRHAGPAEADSTVADVTGGSPTSLIPTTEMHPPTARRSARRVP